MDRSAFSQLVAWKQKPSRKPLIVHGARQVGKTWLLKEFGKRSYRNVAYINFEANKGMASLFSSDLDLDRILLGLRVEAVCPIEPETTLIIFDEVQECPSALTSLKYFAEDGASYHVAAAGSLLGLAMHSGVSFPVGKVDFLRLFPLSFGEYLTAMGATDLVTVIDTGEWKMVEAFRQKLIDLLRIYYCLGGMPEVVKTFLEGRDMNRARELQTQLLLSYEQDFSKYAKPDLAPRIRSVWNSIPAQLAREQRKFVYGLVRQGARAREYETAIEWLSDAGLLHKVHRVAKPGLPLKSYQEPKAFKIYMHDIGLLAAHSGVPLRTVLEGDSLFEEFKGALTEQYVDQELHMRDSLDLGYWSSDASQAEVDFIIQAEGSIFPLEVKASENLQAKSLRSYRDRFTPARCFRASLSPYREEDWITNLPLYALARIPAEMRKWA